MRALRTRDFMVIAECIGLAVTGYVTARLLYWAMITWGWI